MKRYNVISSQELCHWGIIGMKWGIRRYRNPDGTLTAAGKKRYSGNKHIGELSKEERHDRLMKSRDPILLNKYKHELSDAEIKDKNAIIREIDALSKSASNAQSRKWYAKLAKYILENGPKYVSQILGDTAKSGSGAVKWIVNEIYSDDDNKHK